MIHKMGYDALCETCTRPMMFDEIDEAGVCGECNMLADGAQIKRLRALYEAEKRAGLTDPGQLRQDIIDAGRGHLLAPW